MKQLHFFLILIFAFANLGSGPAFAKKMDLETHHELIEKLESIALAEAKSQKMQSDSMIKTSQVELRLADLYAERARLMSMEEEGTGEKKYQKQIEKDRRQALNIYQKQITYHKDKMPVEERAKTYMQASHLCYMLGKIQDAEKLNAALLKQIHQFKPQTQALAYTQLGDLKFDQGQYKQALPLFQKASAIKENPRLHYSLYRKAWCELNLGQNEQATDDLISILKMKTDAAFQEDVARDLSLFLAREKYSSQNLQTLSQMSPTSVRKKNIINYAIELDRNGQKQASLLVWQELKKEDLTFEEKLEGQLQLTQIQYDLGNKSQVVIELQNSILLLKSSDCRGLSECELGVQNLKKLIGNWNKAEQRDPSLQLVSAYDVYTKNYDDYEMNYWAAQLAQKRKAYVHAVNFFFRASKILKDDPALSEKDSRPQKLFEGSLLGAIENADLSKNAELRLKAYEHYLSLNPKGEKAFEVQFQIAHWYFEQKQHLKSIELFTEFVQAGKAPKELRARGAEEAMEQLVQLRNESEIENHAMIFSQNLPEKKQHYLEIWRKSILNQSANIVHAQASSPNSPQKVDSDKGLQFWKKVDRLDPLAWPAADRRKILKNQLLLAGNLNDSEKIDHSADMIIRDSSSTFEDRQLALAQKMRNAELRMNFKEALKWAEKLDPAFSANSSNKKSAKDQIEAHWLRLAVLAELSGQNPSSYYRKFLQLSHSPELRKKAAYQLVLHSANPWATFRSLQSEMRGDRRYTTPLLIWIFENSSSSRVQQALQSERPTRSTVEGFLYHHQDAMREFQQTQRTIQKAKLDSSSDWKAQSTLKKRLQLLQNIEYAIVVSSRSRDLALQFLYLSLLAEEKSRLASEIMQMPVPRSLKAKQKAEYQAQLAEQVKPMLAQGTQARMKAEESWKSLQNSERMKQMTQMIGQKMRSGARLAESEVAMLYKKAQDMRLTSDEIVQFTQQRRKVESEALELQQDLASDPMNIQSLERLRGLYHQLGNGSFVAYLQDRLTEMKVRGKSL